MKLRALKRRHDARTVRRARIRAALSPYPMDDDWWADEDEPRDRTCWACSGTGGDPWNDGITPCEACDGEGYEWWN